MKKNGGDAIYLKTDVTSSQDMQALIKFTLEHYGRIDVLINNAGVMPLSQLQELKVDEWDRMIDINIKGVLYALLPCSGGRSRAGASPNQPPYFHFQICLLFISHEKKDFFSGLEPSLCYHSKKGEESII